MQERAKTGDLCTRIVIRAALVKFGTVSADDGSVLLLSPSAFSSHESQQVMSRWRMKNKKVALWVHSLPTTDRTRTAFRTGEQDVVLD